MDVFHRQREILTPEHLVDVDIDVAGAGSLGGAIVICLGKMGFGIENTITVTDFDHCESHNLPTQWFRPSHVMLSQPKVEALEEMMALICDREIAGVEARFTGDEERRLAPVVILAVDSLRERRRIWERLRRRDDVRLVVDARAGAETVEVRCVDMQWDEFTAYERSLDDEDEALEEPCTRRAILYTVMGAAAFVGSVVRAWVREEKFPRHVAFDFRNFFLLKETD